MANAIAAFSSWTKPIWLHRWKPPFPFSLNFYRWYRHLNFIPAYTQWVQQDQIILSLLISSLTRILNLHMQNLKQDDLTVIQNLHKAKLIYDELAPSGRPLYLVDHKIYIFKGLPSEFKVLVTKLSARPKPVNFSELHSFET